MNFTANIRKHPPLQATGTVYYAACRWGLSAYRLVDVSVPPGSAAHRGPDSRRRFSDARCSCAAEGGTAGLGRLQAVRFPGAEILFVSPSVFRCSHSEAGHYLFGLPREGGARASGHFLFEPFCIWQSLRWCCVSLWRHSE